MVTVLLGGAAQRSPLLAGWDDMPAKLLLVALVVALSIVRKSGPSEELAQCDDMPSKKGGVKRQRRSGGAAPAATPPVVNGLEMMVSVFVEVSCRRTKRT